MRLWQLCMYMNWKQRWRHSTILDHFKSLARSQSFTLSMNSEPTDSFLCFVSQNKKIDWCQSASRRQGALPDEWSDDPKTNKTSEPSLSSYWSKTNETPWSDVHWQTFTSSDSKRTIQQCPETVSSAVCFEIHASNCRIRLVWRQIFVEVCEDLEFMGQLIL